MFDQPPQISQSTVNFCHQNAPGVARQIQGVCLEAMNWMQRAAGVIGVIHAGAELFLEAQPQAAAQPVVPAPQQVPVAQAAAPAYAPQPAYAPPPPPAPVPAPAVPPPPPPPVQQVVPPQPAVCVSAAGVSLL